MKGPLGPKILILLNLFLAIGALPTGILFLLDPSGKTLGIQSVLPKISFLNNFALVGAWLIVVYGMLPIVLSVGLWTQQRWAWIATIVLGFIEIAWIISETTILGGFTILYPLYGGIGLLTVVISFLPSVRKFYKEFTDAKVMNESTRYFASNTVSQ